MNIFFLGVRDPKLVDTYKGIIEFLRKSGHTVDADWLQTSAKEDADDFENSYNRNMTSIKKADVVVAETSHVSSGIGFMIATALKEKKPVLTIYNKEFSKSVSATLQGSSKKNRLLTTKEYTALSELEALIVEYVEMVRKQLDTKFILIISPEIERYLEWSADNRRMHKAQVVRNAVEELIVKDKEYNKHLQDDL